MTKTLWSGDTYTWYYYLEVLPGQVTTGLTTRTDGGKTYYLYNTTTINGSGISLTYDEDYFPITGFLHSETMLYQSLIETTRHTCTTRATAIR